MKAAKIATWAAAAFLVLVLVKHGAVAAMVAHFQGAARAGAGAPGIPPHFGVTLPGYVVFLTKLDHFAVDFGSVLLRVLPASVPESLGLI